MLNYQKINTTIYCLRAEKTSRALDEWSTVLLNPTKHAIELMRTTVYIIPKVQTIALESS